MKNAPENENMNSAKDSIVIDIGLACRVVIVVGVFVFTAVIFFCCEQLSGGAQKRTFLEKENAHTHTHHRWRNMM